MAHYDSRRFITELRKKLDSNDVSPCPICGKRSFTTTDKVAAILIGDDTQSLSLGPNIPSGMLICENCGHISFFALGILGLMEGERERGE